MPSISSSVGLVSGIDSKAIIDQLMALEERPKVKLQQRIATQTSKKTAYTTLQAQVTSLRLFGTQMKKPQTFRNADVTSGDDKVVTGKAAAGAAAGSYQISVARLVSSQQTIGKGFADTDMTRVGAGTMTLELGGGGLREPTSLDALNGGEGVRRGSFRITDRAGISADIDIGDAVTLNDVVDKINTAEGINVKATIANDALVLTDQTGRTTSKLIVADIGTSEAAGDLGIRQTATAAVVTGTKIGGLRASTKLSALNDGRGIGTNGTSAADLQFKLANGTLVAVDLDGAATVGDAITRINTALGARGAADLNAAGTGLKVTDTSRSYTGLPAGSRMTVTSLNGTTAAADLGWSATASSTGLLDGTGVASGINTTLVSSLNGGKGLTLGTIRIKDRAGVSSDVNLAGATTVDEILTRINAATVNVNADVKSGGSGITLADKTGKLGQLVISDVTGTTAAQLGLTGTFAADQAHAVISGSNLQRAWFTRNTSLKDLNGGKGVPDGKFTITDSTGKTRTIAVDGTKDTNVGDLIDKINVGSGVKASINANGDGLLLTDTAGGATKLKVEESNNGSTAKSLNLLGTATATTIDGSWEKTLTVKPTDTLDDVQKSIQALGWGLSSTIVNDGSSDTPYRLSLTSTNSGRAGRVMFDSGAVNLGERTLVEAQDAAVFVGGDAGTEPLLVRASSNEVTGAIRGVTLSLTGVSDKPVTLNVARNVDNVVAAAGAFVESFNTLVEAVKTYTKFDTETNTRGELLGDPAALSIETEIYGMLNTVGNASGKYRIAADVGFSIGSSGTLEFNEEKFRAAFADDPDAVTTLFTRSGNALDDDTALSTLRQGKGVRSVTGNDFRLLAKDGTTFDVDIGEATNVADILKLINDATGNNGKIKASINSAGTGIDLVDASTTGTKKLTVTTLNGSIAASDLGLLSTSSGGRVSGRPLIDSNSGNDGGIGTILEKRLNRLIDPVNGVLTRASKQVDTRSDEFQDRIDSLDKLLENKRSRLEKQFSGLESSLSNLQGQQTALNAFTPVSYSK